MTYNPIGNTNCQAWYPMTVCKYLTDLTGNHPVLQNEGNYPTFIPGANAVYGLTRYGSTNSGNSYVADADLVSGFPKGSTFSVLFWHNAYSDNSLVSFDDYTDCGCWNQTDNNRCWRIVHRGNGSSPIQSAWGIEISTDGTAAGIEAHWTTDYFEYNATDYYCVACTLNVGSGAYRIRVYDAAADTVHNYTGTFTGTPYNGSNANFTIGGCHNLPSVAQTLAGSDNYSLYKVALDAQDIDNIRLGNAVPTDWGTNCVGWWGLDASDLLKDSSANANHIVNWSTSTNSHRQGDAGFFINESDTQYGDYCMHSLSLQWAAYTVISNFNSDFPLRTADTTRKLTICFWVNPRYIHATLSTVVAGWIISGNGFYFGWKAGTGYPRIFIYKDLYNSEFVEYDSVFVEDDWYHVGVTFDGTTGDYRIRIWDETNQQFLDSDKTGTSTNVPVACTDTYEFGMPTSIGHGTFDLDDVVVFNDILTTDDIDEIRNQTYNPTPDETIPTVNLGVESETSLFQVRIMADPPKRNLIETLSWLTDIIKPDFSDDEQRIALRTIPRQSFSYEYFINTAHRRRRFLSAIAGFAKKELGIPVWGECVEHAGTLSAGASSITVDTTNADFRNSSYGLIWSDEDSWEILHITSKNDTTLTLGANLVNTYTGTKFIMPLRRGYLGEGPDVTPLKTGGAEVNAHYECHDGAAISGWSASQTYDGYDVITFGNLIPSEEGVPQHHNKDAMLLDNTTGLLGIDKKNEFEVTTQEFNIDRQTKAQIWELKQWLHSIYGRQKSFLIPTYEKNMALSRTVGAGDATIYITNVRLNLHYESYDLLQYIGFLNSDGTVTIRKISSIDYVSETEESITLTTTVGTAYTTSATLMFVWRCRLGSDSVNLEYYDRYKCRMKTSLVRVTL